MTRQMMAPATLFLIVSAKRLGETTSRRIKAPGNSSQSGCKTCSHKKHFRSLHKQDEVDNMPKWIIMYEVSNQLKSLAHQVCISKRQGCKKSTLGCP